MYFPYDILAIVIIITENVYIVTQPYAQVD